MRSCVQPVYAAHMAAGPDGFRWPSPKPQSRPKCVPDIRRGVSAGGLTLLHHLNGLASRVFPFFQLYNAKFVAFVPGEDSPNDPRRFIGHGNGGES